MNQNNKTCSLWQRLFTGSNCLFKIIDSGNIANPFDVDQVIGKYYHMQCEICGKITKKNLKGF